MSSVILGAGARILGLFMIVFSVYVLLRGHNDPGGGFIAGLIAASAIALHAFAYGVKVTRQRLRLHPCAIAALGLLFATLSGLPAIAVTAEPFLTHLWATVPLGLTDLKVGTALIFDVGVYLVVVGGVAAFLFALLED